jgi:hypothetical protein
MTSRFPASDQLCRRVRLSDMAGPRAVTIDEAKAGLFVVRNPKDTADTRLFHRTLRCRSRWFVGLPSRRGRVHRPGCAWRQVCELSGLPTVRIRTDGGYWGTSALAPIADPGRASREVGLVPTADSASCARSVRLHKRTRAYSGNPAFRSPSINSFAFDSPLRAMNADIVKAGSTSSRRAAAARASASCPR